VANIGGANAVSVAEHTVMLALMLLKRAVYAHSKLVGGQWTQGELMNVVGEIYGKTWGVLGMGRIGREVTARVLAFGAKVIYYDVVRREEVEKLGVEYRPFNRLLAESDILSIHVPLKPETRGMIGERAKDDKAYGDSHKRIKGRDHRRGGVGEGCAGGAGSPGSGWTSSPWSLRRLTTRFCRRLGRALTWWSPRT